MSNVTTPACATASARQARPKAKKPAVRRKAKGVEQPAGARIFWKDYCLSGLPIPREAVERRFRFENTVIPASADGDFVSGRGRTRYFWRKQAMEWAQWYRRGWMPETALSFAKSYLASYRKLQALDCPSPCANMCALYALSVGAKTSALFGGAL